MRQRVNNSRDKEVLWIKTSGKKKFERLGRLLTYQLTIKLVFFARKYIFVSPHLRSLVYRCCLFVFLFLCFFSCDVFWKQATLCPLTFPPLDERFDTARAANVKNCRIVRVLLNIYKKTHENFVFRAHWLSSLRNFPFLRNPSLSLWRKTFSPFEESLCTHFSFLHRTTHFARGGRFDWNGGMEAE